MKIKLVLIHIFFLLFSLSGSITFEKNLGAEWDDHGNAVCQTSDGGYLIAGDMIDSLDYTYTFLIMTKLYPAGEIDWLFWVSGAVFTDVSYPYNVGYSVIESNDGGYVVAGSIDAMYMGWLHTDIFVIKTDIDGNILWYYQDINDSQMCSAAFQIIQTKDNGYIIICEDGGFGGGFQYDLLLKLDSEGKEIWRKYYSYNVNGRSILQTKEGGFAFIGTTEDESENVVLTLVKTDSMANEIWSKTYNGLFSFSMGYTLKNTTDDGYIIFGLTDQEAYGDLAKLIKTDENGEKIWEKYYGNSNFLDENTVGRSLDITDDGGYILAGYTENISTGLADAWLIKTDPEGNETWKKTYGREGDDRFYSVIQTADGGYIMTGYTDSFGFGGKDVWVVKTDENGTEIESPFLPQTTELYQNYPNPFNPETEIKFNLQSKCNVNIAVFNSKGELIKILLDGIQDTGLHSVHFDATGLNSGIYFYKLTTADNSITRKMLLLR